MSQISNGHLEGFHGMLTDMLYKYHFHALKSFERRLGSYITEFYKYDKKENLHRTLEFQLTPADDTTIIKFAVVAAARVENYKATAICWPVVMPLELPSHSIKAKAEQEKFHRLVRWAVHEAFLAVNELRPNVMQPTRIIDEVCL